MATQPAGTAADRRMQIASFPYLAGNWDEAQAIYGPGGAVRETMVDLFQEQNITVLAAYPVYFGGISLNVDNPKAGSTDPNGIKVRVPGIKSFQLTGEALGYIPSPIPSPKPSRRFRPASWTVSSGRVRKAITPRSGT